MKKRGLVSWNSFLHHDRAPPNSIFKTAFILLWPWRMRPFLHDSINNILHRQGRQSVPKSGRSERGGERNFGVAPKNALLKGYFYPNFRGGAEKVVVHMHWLTWLLWRHWLYDFITWSMVINEIIFHTRNEPDIDFSYFQKFNVYRLIENRYWLHTNI